MLSADTNIFLYAAQPGDARHGAARTFFEEATTSGAEFVTCELVLVEIYMQLRNPAVLANPLSSADAAHFCETLRANPKWQHVDYHPEVSRALWTWAGATGAGFRKIIDARIAFTLLHHGIEEFATANLRDFASFGFARVFDPTSH